MVLYAETAAYPKSFSAIPNSGDNQLNDPSAKGPGTTFKHNQLWIILLTFPAQPPIIYSRNMGSSRKHQIPIKWGPGVLRTQ